MVAPVRRFIYTVSRLCDLFPSVLSQTEMDHGWYLDPVAGTLLLSFILPSFLKFLAFYFILE